MEDGLTYELEVHLSGLTARELRVQVPGESIWNISVQEEVGSVGPRVDTKWRFHFSRNTIIASCWM
jgi:hypothetical protein